MFFTVLSLGLFPDSATGQKQEFLLKDQLQRSIVIPARAEHILSLQPEITRLLLALGAADRLVGVDYFIHRNDHLFKLIHPAGADLPVVSQPDGSVNKEMIARLAPDLIFLSPTEQQVPDAIERSLGIPVAALASMGRFSGLLEELELVGRLVGKEERARELVHYFREKVRVISETIGALEETERPKTYLAFWSSLIRTPVFYDPVTVAGGQNVADRLLPSRLGTASAVINLEQIIKWNPDVILIHGSYPPRERRVTVEGILADRRLGSVRAIKDRQVHYTLGFWYWWDPAGVLVETLYLARLFHPEKFSALDLGREGEAIYEKFYGRTGIFRALMKILEFDEWTSK